MKNIYYFILALSIICLTYCTKDKAPCPTSIPEHEVWEKFIGEYNVYDTIGNFIYQMEIKHHFNGVNVHGNIVDSLIILNFADTADLFIEMRNYIDNRVLSIGFNESVTGHNGQTWQFYDNVEDTTTVELENTLINDTIVLFFRQTNIQYWVNEGVPYYYCDCKQIAVKH